MPTQRKGKPLKIPCKNYRQKSNSDAGDAHNRENTSNKITRTWTLYD